MKFVETLGRHQNQKGVFQYKRGSTGITISSAIGNAGLDPNQIFIKRAEWTAILQAVENAPRETFGLTVGGGGGNPASSLYDLIEQAVPNPGKGWQWHTSWKSYVCAILEHEGSLEFYSGALGPNNQARIILTRDIR
jgi:hypothetical protein